jgi:hypothetical protein
MSVARATTAAGTEEGVPKTAPQPVAARVTFAKEAQASPLASSLLAREVAARTAGPPLAVGVDPEVVSPARQVARRVAVAAAARRQAGTRSEWAARQEAARVEVAVVAAATGEASTAAPAVDRAPREAAAVAPAT